MNKKVIIIVAAAVLCLAIIVALILSNIIGGGSATSTSQVSSSSSSSDSSTATSVSEAQASSTSDSSQDSSLSISVSMPIVGEDTKPPEYVIENDAFDTTDFSNYLLTFSMYFHDPLTGVSNLRSISGQHWLTAAYVGNLVWVADYAANTQYEMDSNGNVQMPVARLVQATTEIFGFSYDFEELINGSYSYMVSNGYFSMPTGYDMVGTPYVDLSSMQLSVQGNTIIADVTVVASNGSSPEAGTSTYGNYRYTFTLDESQTFTPYRLVSIVKL